MWPRLQAELRRVVPATQYEIWLAPLEPGGFDGERLTVLAPAELRDWVAERFTGALRRAAASAFELPALRLVIEPLDAPEPPERATAVRTASRATPERPAATAAPAPERLNPRFTFEQFVIGPTNRLAHAAALAVAELPGSAYNPLFLHGPPGTGKTHLLHAIGNYVRLYGGGLTVRYTTVERFTNEFVSALRQGGLDAFKDHHRRTDLLLVDDVQFLTGKAKTAEELFHTVNALAETGAQLVLTADRVPAELEKVTERLRERFAAGLVCDLAAPDRITRLAVLRKRAHHDGVALADGVLELLADHVEGNVRALEGALIRVVAFASLRDAAITVDLARDVLGDLYSERPQPGAARTPPAGGAPSIEAIQDATAAHFGLTREELLSKSRSTRVTWPRQVAMFLARERTGQSLPAIGAAFGGRDHTTVLHACKRTAARVAVDRDAQEAVRLLTAELGATAPSPGADRAD
jgi:chromosomal replication initiator protein